MGDTTLPGILPGGYGPTDNMVTSPRSYKRLAHLTNVTQIDYNKYWQK